MDRRRRCRNCRELRLPRRRGLCWICYEDPAIRQRFPSRAICCKPGVGRTGTTAPPARPVLLPPPGKQRLTLYRRRALQGTALFHPEDWHDLT